MTSHTGDMDAQIQEFLDHVSIERGLARNTVSAYARDLRRYRQWLGDHEIVTIDQIHSTDIANFQHDLKAGANGSKPLASASVARAMVTIREWHKFAQSQGWTSDNPAVVVHPPSIGKRLPHALNIEQVTRLLNAPDRSTPMGLRQACLLELLYGTGARISEILDLDVDDVMRMLDDDQMGLLLTGKGDKQRVVPVGSYARQALQAWLVRGRPAFLATAKHITPAVMMTTQGTRMSRQLAWLDIRKMADQAQIATDISPHTLRHSYATHLLEGGANIREVQELLGHSSLTTTQIYTQVTIDHLREVYRSAHPRAR